MSCHWLSYLYELHMALSVKCYMNMHESLEAVAKGFTCNHVNRIRGQMQQDTLLHFFLEFFPESITYFQVANRMHYVYSWLGYV